ncbi:MAG: dihydropteroate synthase [Clostridiales bacterium]|nr:dihydropteroate synthase [Clostridiales bacterium]MDY3747447.1 dihydropteroate synthase [Lachnospiraceae bacterium]
MKIGNRIFDIGSHTYIMGILNVTPDSFSDGGSYKTVDDALYRTEQMIGEGADIIDVGGESTRPGYKKTLTNEEEMARVLPVIEKIREKFDIPISIDTHKAQVAEAAILAGADLVNDIWGFKYDAKMADIVKKYDAACCLMHNKNEAVYHNFMKECADELKSSVMLAKAAGISDDKIMIDPGVGFGKTYEHNLIVLKHLKDFNALGYPVLLGASRKSVIGLTLDTSVDDRVIGTCVTTAFAAAAGTAFVRVHDIKANKQAIMMAEAINHMNQ